MAKLPYVPPEITIEPAPEPKRGSLSLRLPFGLCKKYGISLPEDATPRDAWNALKGIGISPKDEYDKFFGDDNADKKDGEKKTDNTLESRINSIFSNSGATKNFNYNNQFTEQYAKDQFSAGNDEYKKIVVDALEGSNITYRQGAQDECFSAIGRVHLTVDPDYGGEKSAYSKGEVFYHETFHAIDGAYATHWGAMASNTYRDENGKTLYDVLKAEKRLFTSEKIQEVTAMRNKEVDDLIASEGMDVKKIEDTWKAIRQKMSGFAYGTPEYNAIRESDEFKKAHINKSTLDAKRLVYQRKFHKKYGFISDIMSQYNSSLGMGHASSYWRKDKFNAAAEFFAEVGAHAATSPEPLEIVRKYFPQSTALAERIIDDIKTGKLQKHR